MKDPVWIAKIKSNFDKSLIGDVKEVIGYDVKSEYSKNKNDEGYTEQITEAINTTLQYQFEPQEAGFRSLTPSRYLNLPGLKEAYFSSLDGTELFKMTTGVQLEPA